MKNKKLALLLCIVLVLSLFVVCACEEPTPTHEHQYVEHKAVVATCTQKGNEKYYTCSGCDKIFDANMQEITAIPETAMAEHDLETVVSADGSKHYDQCKNCSYKTEEVDHNYAWVNGENNTAVLKCECGHEELTCNTTVAEEDRILVDAWGSSFEIDLSKYATGLKFESLKNGETTATATESQGKVTVTTSSLFTEATATGDCELTLTVSSNSKNLEVKVLVKAVCVVDSIEDLKKLAYTSGESAVATESSYTVGATIDENGKVISQTLYVLTTDIDGRDYDFEENTEYSVASTHANIAKAGFRGIFDGQGHTIKNFVVNAKGFFGQIGQSGIVKNVTFSGIELGDDACVIGKLMDSSIENVKVEGITISATRSIYSTGVAFGAQVFSANIKDFSTDATSYTNAVCLLASNFDGGVDGEEWDYTSFSNVSVKAVYGVNMNLFSNKTITDTIEGLAIAYNPFTIAMPQADSSEYYYTGNEITYKVAESSLYSVTGNKQTEIGVYTVTISLTEPAASWAGAEEGKEKADITFTFEIKEMTSAKAQEIADAFKAKVPSTPEYPRDNALIASLLAEYEVAHANVQALLTAEKATLDGYKTEADKWTVAYTDTYTGWWEAWKGGSSSAVKYGTADDSQFGSVVTVDFGTIQGGSIKNAVAVDYASSDIIVFYVYNPTESDIKITFCAGYASGGWGIASVTAVSKQWTKVELSSAVFAKANGGEKDRTCMIISSNDSLGEWKFSNYYGYVDSASAQAVVDAINALPELEILTVNDETAIVNARNAYDALGLGGKSIVTNYSKLTDSETKIVEVKDKKAAEDVVALIDALDKDNIDADKVVEAYKAYEALTETQKGYIASEKVTKLDDCKVLAESAIKQATIDTFKGKVPATPEYPRDNALIASLLEEYATFSADIQSELTAEKTALDGYKAEADKWVALFVPSSENLTSINFSEDMGSKWAGTQTVGTDDTYGAVLVLNVESGHGGGREAEYKIKVAGTIKQYDNIVFYIYCPLQDGGSLRAYPSNWSTPKDYAIVSGWNKITVDTTMFSADALKGCFFLMTGATSPAGEWKVSTYYGFVNAEGARAVVSAIDALPSAESITLDSKTAVEDARKAYDALGTGAQKLVSNLEKLTACEAKIAELAGASSNEPIATTLTIGTMTDSGTTGEHGTIYNMIGSSSKDNYFSKFLQGTLAKELPANCSTFTFWIYNPTDVVVKIHLGGSVTAWKDMPATSLASKAWTQVVITAEEIELNNNGTWYIYAVAWDDVAKKDVGYAKTEGWQMTSIFAVPDEKEESKEPVATTLAISVITDSGETGDHGTIYNLSQGAWYIENNVKDTMGSFAAGALSAALPEGYASYKFWIYNPCDVDVTFHLSGGNPWKDCPNFNLTSKAWTEVVISASDIAINDTGVLYAYFVRWNNDTQVNDPYANAEGWKVTAIFAIPAVEYKETTLTIGVMTDSGETGDHGTIYNLSQGAWFVENNNKDTMGNFAKGTLSSALPEGCSSYIFWIYNPCDVDVTFYLAGGNPWTNGQLFTATSKAWTEVVISASEIAICDTDAMYVYCVRWNDEKQANDPYANVEGWKVTAIFGVPTAE